MLRHYVGSMARAAPLVHVRIVEKSDPDHLRERGCLGTLLKTQEDVAAAAMGSEGPGEEN